MDVSSPSPVNHHAHHPGFTGATGALFGLIMVVMGRAKARLAADVASVADADHVVDVGCGPGTAVRAAAGRGARVTGVDPAPVMLRLARILTRDQPGITWADGVAEDLPLQDGSATVVWSLATVHHWKDVHRGTRRGAPSSGLWWAVPRDRAAGASGGDRARRPPGWTEHQAESFAAQCRTAGLQNVQIENQRTGRRAVWVVSGVRR